MARSFNNGHQSEALYNVELNELYRMLEHMLDRPSNTLIGPSTDKNGALWLDRVSGGKLKYRESGVWKNIFHNELQIISELLAPNAPTNPVPGQLWIDGGTLKYYDPLKGWTVMLAQTTNMGNGFESFKDFIYNMSLDSKGSKVTDPRLDPPTIYRQYLLPDANLDRVFINGALILDEEREEDPSDQNKEIVTRDGVLHASDVSIQLQDIYADGKSIQTIHTNPSRLTDLKRTLVLLDGIKTDLNVPTTDTEYYGFSNGMGALLAQNKDYTVSPFGIVLLGDAIKYDFVLAQTYIFSSIVNTKGTLKKITRKLGTKTSVPLGMTANETDLKNMLVFHQGLYLDNTRLENGVEVENFNLSAGKKHLEISLENPTDLTSICCILTSKKYRGEITKRDTATNEGIVDLSAINVTTNNPLVLVKGISGYVPADYTINKTELRVQGVTTTPMEVAIMDIENDMFVQRGTVPTPAPGQNPAIEYNTADLPDDERCVLFLKGLCITDPDVIRTSISATKGSLSVDGIQPGQDYLILKDPQDKVLFNNYISFSTVPTELLSAANVYLGSSMLCNAEAAYVAKLPNQDIYDGEIKCLVEGSNKTWTFYSLNGVYEYMDGGKLKNFNLRDIITVPKDYPEGWFKVVPDDADFKVIASEPNSETLKRKTLFDIYKKEGLERIPKLDKGVLGFTTNEDSITVLHNVANQDITTYAYSYANTINEPLQCGMIEFDDDNPNQQEYAVNIRHNYPVGVNAVSIWIDGIKQYNFQTVEKEDGKTIVIPQPLGIDPLKQHFDAHLDDYDKWKKETGKSVYTPVPAASRIFYCLERLEPGETLACRRTILDPSHRIPGTINTYKTDFSLYPGNVRVFVGGLRMPIGKVNILSVDTISIETSYYGGTDSYDPKFSSDDILIEVRNDFNLKEYTTEVVTSGQNTFTVMEDKIPQDLLASRDFIMIYINGYAYGTEYKVDRLNGSITLTNEKLYTSLLGNKDSNTNSNLENHFKKNPNKRQDCINSGTKIAGYNPDIITFEWR